MGYLLRALSHGAKFKWALLQSLQDYQRSGGSRQGLAERAEWLHRSSARGLGRLGVEVTCNGSLPASGLIVSNHLSYLDILVFSSVMPCVFVSKAEVRKWPVFGMMASMAGTVYIDRKRKSDTVNANEGIRQALQQGLRVVVFPEGTSSDGSGVRPFYPSLFEPAVENRSPVTAAYLRYEMEEGSVGTDIAYWGEMTFFPHLLRLLGKKGIRAKIRFSPTPRSFEDRKLAALEMREEVVRLSE
jgi:1-acyl-sn-glycerol-3-phosphate acyltransferase